MLSVLLALLQTMCVKNHWDQPADHTREIAICEMAMDLLTEACRDNPGNGCALSDSLAQLLKHEIETELPTAKTLTQVFSNNKELLGGIHQRIIDEQFMKLLKQEGTKGRKGRYLDFLASLCIIRHSNLRRSPCLHNQFIIANCLLVVNKGKTMLQLSHSENSTGGKNSITGMDENIADMQVELIGHDGHKAGIGVVFDPDTHALANTQDYYVAQINLFAELCRGRNEGCAGLLVKTQPIYTFDVVLKVMSKDMFPSNLRAAFCRLMLTLFLDAFDYIEEKKVPMLVRPDMVCNYFQRGDEQFSGETLLKAFVLDFLTYSRVISNADRVGNFDEEDCKLLLAVIEILTKMIRLGLLVKKDIGPVARALTCLLDARNRDETMNAPRDDVYLPNPAKQVADHYKEYVDQMEILNRANVYGGPRYANTKRNLIMFEVKSAVCDAISLLFDIRLDEHIDLYLSHDRRKQRKTELSEQGVFGSNLEPTAQEGLTEFVDKIDEDASIYAGIASYEFVDVMFDLAMHDNERLSTLAIGLAARQCGQHDELLAALSELTLLPADSNPRQQEFFECLAKMKRTMRLLQVEKGNRHYQQEMNTRLKEMERMLSEVTNPGQPSYQVQCFFRAMNVEEFILEIIGLYSNKIFHEQGWLDQTINWDVRDIYRSALALLGNACYRSPTTQNALFQHIWTFLALLGHSLGCTTLIMAMFYENTPLRMKLKEEHIAAIIKVMITSTTPGGSEWKIKYITALRHLVKSQQTSVAPQVKLRKMQVAVMNQLMLPDIFNCTLKLVFDKQMRTDMLQSREFDSFYEFSLRIIKLLVVCCEDNGAARTQCRSLIRCTDICELLLTEEEEFPEYVPAKMQRMYINLLRTAYVENEDFHVDRGVQLKVWEVIQERTLWALKERVLTTQPSKSVLIASILPLMDSMVKATQGRPGHGWVFDDQEKMKTMKTRLDDIWEVVAKGPFKDFAAGVLIGMDDMWEHSAFHQVKRSTIEASAMQVDTSFLDRSESGPSEYEKNRNTMKEKRHNLELNPDFGQHARFFNLMLVEKLTSNLLKAPHWCVVGETLRHLANMEPDNILGSQRMLLMLRAFKNILKLGPSDDDNNDNQTAKSKSRRETKRFNFLHPNPNPDSM